MNDRFLLACQREPVDATPVWFMRQAGRSLPEYRAIRERASLLEITRDAALCAEVTLQPVGRLGVDAAIIFADITSPLPGMGVAMDIHDGVGPVIADPIRSMAQVDALRAFDARASVGPMLEAISIVSREAGVPVIGFAGAPFTLASYLVEGRSARDPLRLKTLMRAEPATFDALLARIVDMTVAYLAAQVAAGAQVVQVFDSWIGALAPAEYDEHVAPHVLRLFAGLAGLGVPSIHFGGGAPGLLERLAAAGGDVMGLDWRVELGTAWARVPGRAVQGNLDPSALLGPFDVTAAQARLILEAAAGRPGHVFNLGHGVLPATDPDDLRRLVDLVHEHTAVAATVPAGAAR